MSRTVYIVGAVIFLVIVIIAVTMNNERSETNTFTPSTDNENAVAYFAGGCFWCVESDLEKNPAVQDVVSGYMGGTTENPTYENYSKNGHREVVKVIYDPTVTSYTDLVHHLLRHVDPTDGEGSFGDRGVQYAPAIYYQDETEKETAERILKELNSSDRFEEPLAVPVLKAKTFWTAEGYHQDYAENNSIRYNLYRKASGRDAFIDKHWSEKEQKEYIQIENLTPEKESIFSKTKENWENFEKPSNKKLQEMLSPIEYKVTQKDGTEKPFDNEYWDNTQEGIYVDVVSGEPLFSSTHQYKSGTGWPSFTEPIHPSVVTEHEDFSLFSKRTEIRSTFADSHLGHVFADGPKEQGGLRYCMNSAALRFIPKEELKGTRYESYLSLFEGSIE